jgi:prophage maintenance system killer protein
MAQRPAFAIHARWKPPSSHRRLVTTNTSLPNAVAKVERLDINHPFVDGTTRVALATIDVFLRIDRQYLALLPHPACT